MSRSPLAYPLTRGIDGESGGAADLQTDIMRFMAILSLCLMAIFALVQSIPLSPIEPVEIPVPIQTATQDESNHVAANVSAPEPPAKKASVRETVEANTDAVTTETETDRTNVVLKRPKWVSNFQPTQVEPTSAPSASKQRENIDAARVKFASESASDPQTSDKTSSDEYGFTLRFESDIALTRLVAAGQVGFYAIDAGRARRMSVSDSRISFWDASTPGSFHEMEATTVPKSVIDALSRTGVETGSVDWGVTLPGKLRAELDTLMRQHDGGALVIRMDGKLNLEST